MDVAWPDRRQDVLNALGLLAAEPPELDSTGQDRRWPGLTEAIHWLVDDTAWDFQDPVESIGTMLRDDQEADVVRDVVAAVVAVSKHQGPTSSDASWHGDQHWPDVRQLAADAIACLTR